VILPPFIPKSTWTPPDIGQLPSWSEAKRVAVDIETRDPLLKEMGPGVRRGGYIVGVSFAIEDGPSAYLPVRHEGGGNLDPRHVFAYLKHQASIFKGDLVGANLSYDLDYLAEQEVKFNPRFLRDVQIAEPLCDELQFSYSLENIARRRGVTGKDEAGLRIAAAALGIDPKADLWRMHAGQVGAYAEQDARLPLQLLRIQERQIEEEGLWGVYDLECRLLPVLIKMRRRGVRISFDELDRIERWSIEEEDKSLKELGRLTGIHLSREDTTLNTALVPLVKCIGVPIPKTAQGRDSITKEFLDSLAGPIGGLINRARRFHKLRGTFVNGRRAHAIGDRIHPTFHQLRSEKPGQEDQGGARYGRLSASDPNLQQEPARDEEIGPQWRKVYIPDEGGEWSCLDFSQQEPRWAVHFAEALREPGAILAGDRYRENPETDNHEMMTIIIHGQAVWDSWTKEERKQHRSNAKAIFLGLCYGMGGAKLCHDLGLPTEWKPSRRLGRMIEVAGPEGQRLLDEFDRKVPFIRASARRAEAFASKHGYIKTILGRKCRFPERAVPGPRGERYEWCHKAFNRAIQGSSGDQTKQAMVDADEANIRLQLQVHDELDQTIWSREEAKTLAQIMRDSVACSVPHQIDIEVGPNWADIEKVK
jgi:DNA polymerase I-like protein with 3'-5' exonuclease and polymerase domains